MKCRVCPSEIRSAAELGTSNKFQHNRNEYILESRKNAWDFYYWQVTNQNHICHLQVSATKLLQNQNAPRFQYGVPSPIKIKTRVVLPSSSLKGANWFISHMQSVLTSAKQIMKIYLIFNTIIHISKFKDALCLNTHSSVSISIILQYITLSKFEAHSCTRGSWTHEYEWHICWAFDIALRCCRWRFNIKEQSPNHSQTSEQGKVSGHKLNIGNNMPAESAFDPNP